MANRLLLYAARILVNASGVPTRWRIEMSGTTPAGGTEIREPWTMIVSNQSARRADPIRE
jgi:hypothetical protein